MTAIIRVKRLRGEDPVEALVLSCKRKKTVEDSANDSNTKSNLFKYVLNFSGTVEEKDDKIAATTVESFRKDSKYAELQYKEHIPDIKTKQRKEWKERNNDNRFTLLSCLRSSKALDKSDDSLAQGDAQKNITIVDVSQEKDENQGSQNLCDDSFVYDLYSTNVEFDSDYNDMFMEHLLSVQPLQTEIDYRNGEDCYDEIDPDEDDSNDENNWRNDYPDSDIGNDDGDEEEEPDGDDILARQLNRFHIGDENRESSSESADENYFNFEEDERYCYYEAADVAGRRYARYKANAMKMLMKEEDDDEESEDDYLNPDDSFYGNSD